MRLIGTLVALVSLEANALAFNLVGRSDLEGWDTEELVFNVNYNSGTCLMEKGELDTFIDEALAVWNTVATSSIRLKRGSESTTSAATAVAGEAVDYPLIICDPVFSTTLDPDGNLDTGNIPGVAVPMIRGTRLSGGVMLLNSQSADEANIKAVKDLNAELAKIVVGHEIGHLLGLGHSESENALMYYDASHKKSLRLSQDDIDGISFLYPRQEIGGSKIGGCGSVPLLPGDGPRNIFGGGLGILFLALLTWRSSRLVRV